MRHFLKMTPTFYEKNKTGDLMARSTNDLRAISETAGFGIMTLVDSTVYLVTLIITMGFVVSWKLTLAAILPLPILAFILQVLGKKIHERYMTAQEAFGDLNDNVLEAVAGVRVVRAYVQERASEQQFADMTEDVYKKNMHVEKIDALFMPFSKVLTGIDVYDWTRIWGFLSFSRRNDIRKSCHIQCLFRNDRLADVCDRRVDQRVAARECFLGPGHGDA